MTMPWEEFHADGRLPPERRYVLVAFPEDERAGIAASVVVGYLRYAAGDKSCPYFVTPGFERQGREVARFADCLGDDFEAPYWWFNNRRERTGQVG